MYEPGQGWEGDGGQKESSCSEEIEGEEGSFVACKYFHLFGEEGISTCG